MTDLVAMLLQTAPTPASRPTAAPPVYGYIPILLMFLIATLLPLALLGISRLAHRRTADREKPATAKSSADPVVTEPQRFSVRFFVIAMLVLVFDVETVFLFPWAVIYDKLALFGLVEMLIFIGILAVGYYYAWRKGALEWA